MNQNFLTAVALCPGNKTISFNNLVIPKALDHFTKEFGNEYAATAMIWYLYYATKRQERWIDRKLKQLEAAE
jgi:hypothetical protein